jgi:Activator of Hsp90 ATPase homolog 1-like protein
MGVDHTARVPISTNFVLTGRFTACQPKRCCRHAFIAGRVGNWGRGIYSIARFELVEQSGGTKIIFDHEAFPNGDAGHLASGWQENYWNPLTKFLT